nr:IncW plasmid conjugative relaxase protein TrwC [Acinetobacter baumannii]
MLNSLVRSEMKKLNELDHNDHNFEILVIPISLKRSVNILIIMSLI